MKKIENIMYHLLMLLPLVVTIGVFPALPDQIPAHYDLHDQVNRWGSKYETLLFPIITIVFGLILLGIARYFRQKKERTNAQACMLIGILSLLLFNAMSGYFLYTSFAKVEKLSSLPIDLAQLLFGLLGVMFLLISAVMPKLEKNAILGLRTAWSKKNEQTWRRSQRFGAISFLFTGIGIVITACVSRGLVCTFVSLGMLLVCVCIDVVYTYAAAKKFG